MKSWELTAIAEINLAFPICLLLSPAILCSTKEFAKPASSADLLISVSAPGCIAEIIVMLLSVIDDPYNEKLVLLFMYFPEYGILLIVLSVNLFRRFNTPSRLGRITWVSKIGVAMILILYFLVSTTSFFMMQPGN